MPNTIKSYDLQERKWLTYCCEKVSMQKIHQEIKVLQFLTSLAVKGLGYSSVNTAHSALSVCLP